MNSFLLLAILPFAFAQQQGHQKQEYHLPFKVLQCLDSSCSNNNYEQLSLTLDANWRWTHKVSWKES